MDTNWIITLLRTVSAPKLARHCSVSIKTIYRIRNCEVSPNLRTLEALANGLRDMGVVVDGHGDMSAGMPAVEVFPRAAT